MPFCPSCYAEYVTSISECSDCETRLIAKLNEHEIISDMGDVFICYEPFQADRIAQMLRSMGIKTLIRDRSCSAFPTTLGTTCEQHVAVMTEQWNEAHHIIESAISDHIIPGTGRFL